MGRTVWQTSFLPCILTCLVLALGPTPKCGVVAVVATRPAASIPRQRPFADRSQLLRAPPSGEEAAGHTRSCTPPVFQLQAWWRGTLVRRQIGNFKMFKEKDDSKDSKGKGKGKDKKRGKK